MSNNRMGIKCLYCKEEKMIAKYYPNTGWYFDCVPTGGVSVTITKPDDLTIEKMNELNNYSKVDAFNKFFIEHTHKLDNLMWGATHFKLTFEIKPHEN